MGSYLGTHIGAYIEIAEKDMQRPQEIQYLACCGVKRSKGEVYCPICSKKILLQTESVMEDLSFWDIMDMSGKRELTEAFMSIDNDFMMGRKEGDGNIYVDNFFGSSENDSVTTVTPDMITEGIAEFKATNKEALGVLETFIGKSIEVKYGFIYYYS